MEEGEIIVQDGMIKSGLRRTVGLYLLYAQTIENAHKIKENYRFSS